MIVLRGLLTLADGLLNLYSWVVIARVFASWVGANPFNQVTRTLSALTEPVFRPLRRFFPGIPVGGAILDIAPLLVILLLFVGRLFIAEIMLHTRTGGVSL